jgi:Fic family protein
VNVGRIINPSAVFCSDRNEYYKKLAVADSGAKEVVLEWCEYVLSGLKSEIDKIDKLLEYSVLKDEILSPTIAFSMERQLITDEEAKILRRAIELQIIKANDIKDLFPKKHSSDISHIINRLREKKMLLPIEENKRKYYCCFNNSYLLRGFIKSLDKKFGLFLT